LQFTKKYILGFAAALCLVLSLGVSAVSVALKAPQEANRLHFKRLNVLRAAGVIAESEAPSMAEVARLFESIATLVIDRKSGRTLAADPRGVDPLQLAKAPSTSEPTPARHRATQVARLPERLLAYEIKLAGHEGIVLPIHGNGLWSTMYGFLALGPDFRKVKGLTFYEHGETPGLGGEVDNPAWKALWPGKGALDERGRPAVTVVKAGTVKDADPEVDGLAGATITGRGVAAMLDLWLGEAGYGPFLARRAGLKE